MRKHKIKLLNDLSNAVQSGKIDAYVWATPGLPMLILVTLGLIVALTFGDIVWLLIRFYFRCLKAIKII